jgi:hypothetical protein
VSRVTRSSKIKLQLQQKTKDLTKMFHVIKATKEHKKKQKIEEELDIHTHEKFLFPKDEPEDNKGIHIKESRKQKLKNSTDKQKEPISCDKGK